MSENFVVKSVYFTVFAGDVLENAHGLNEAASVRKYAQEWEAAIRAAYPLADVDWNFDWYGSASDATSGLLVNGQEVERDGSHLVWLVGQHVAYIGARIYCDGSWCVFEGV